MVAHTCPLVAAGLVATLQGLPGFEVVRAEERPRTGWQPVDNVHVLIGDIRRSSELLGRMPRNAESPASRRTRVVLLTEDGQHDHAPALTRRIDACLPMRCPTEDLLATVRRLGHDALGQLPAAEEPVVAPVRSGLTPGTLRRVRQYIEEHLAQPVDLGMLAQVAGLSACHFSRSFKQSMGMPPHRYLVTRRIAAAMALIRDTDRPLCSISLDVGFADQSHFSRTFVQMTGETPGAFRHRCR